MLTGIALNSLLNHCRTGPATSAYAFGTPCRTKKKTEHVLIREEIHEVCDDEMQSDMKMRHGYTDKTIMSLRSEGTLESTLVRTRQVKR